MSVSESLISKKLSLFIRDCPLQRPSLRLRKCFGCPVYFFYGLLEQGGLLVSYCANGQFKRDLKAAGFQVKAYPGALGKREMTRAWKLDPL
ncbi:MnmC family methyltransferase [Shewanella chilikensis]|uniref:MnmC family methyltransferase n=1 Tax=Shewanella chilikensis TaxID=558541 RepID=UPI0030070527